MGRKTHFRFMNRKKFVARGKRGGRPTKLADESTATRNEVDENRPSQHVFEHPPIDIDQQRTRQTMNIFNSSKDVWDYISTFRHQISCFPIPKGAVVQCFVDNGKNGTKTVDVLWQLYRFDKEKSALKIAVSTLHKAVMDKKKNVPANSTNLICLLNEPFRYQPVTSSVVDSLPQPPITSSAVDSLPQPPVTSSAVDSLPQPPVTSSAVDSLPQPPVTSSAVDSLPQPPVTSSAVDSLPQPPVTSSAVDSLPQQTMAVLTRNHCARCTVVKANFTTATVQLKASLRDAKTMVKNIRAAYQVKRIKQSFGRLYNRISKLRNKCKSLQQENKKLNTSLKRAYSSDTKKENFGLKRKLLYADKRLSAERTERKRLGRIVKTLTCEVDHLRSDIEERQSENVNTLPTKTFSEEMRLSVYSALLSSVPVSNTGPLIKYVVEMLGGKSLSHIPSCTTVAQMAYELGVLSLIQISQFLISQDNLTLSWDATSIDGNHINEVHLTAKGHVCLVLDVRAIPGSKASDYTDHIMSALTDAASVYARYTRSPEAEVLATFKSKISNTVTDRAPVNHCVVVQLQAAFESHILELNCNVHPLDALASSARRVLATYDREQAIKGAAFGKNGCAVNCIHALSKLRFKQGVGDPKGFKSFFQRNDVNSGVFVRYVGNRMHVLFHLAGVISQHVPLLLDYLQNYCVGATLRTAVLSDLQQPSILRQVKALGLMGKLITGPWMTHFYSNRSNLEMVPLIKHSKVQLDRWIADPKMAVTNSLNIFSEPLSQSDPVIAALLADAENPVFLEIIRLLLEGFAAVFNRQLHRYFSGDLSSPTPEILSKAASAPSHNISSERALGMTDANWRRAPNATAGFLSGKIKSRLNKTLEWLEDRPDKPELITFAISEGYKVRKLESIRKAALASEYISRQDEVARKRDTAHRRSICKNVKGILGGSLSVSTIQADEDCKKVILDIVRDSGCLVGSLFQHMWEVDGKDLPWFGRISKVKAMKKGQKIVATVGYWEIESPESTSEDYTLSVEDIVTDMILGDIIFFSR